MKATTFFFHYNRPASQAAGKNKLSVHWRNTCYVVDGIRCSVPIKSKNNKTQPRCVMTGKCREFRVVDINGEKIGLILADNTTYCYGI